MSGRQGHPLRYFGGVYQVELRSKEVRGLGRHAYCLWLHLQASTVLHDGQVLELESAVSEIAVRFGVHRSTVRRWARELEDAGLVERVHRTAWGPDGEHNLPVIWRLLIPSSIAAALDSAAAELELPDEGRRIGPRSARRDLRRAQRLLAASEADLAELEIQARRAAAAVPDAEVVAQEVRRLEELIAEEPDLAQRYGELLEEQREALKLVGLGPGLEAEQAAAAAAVGRAEVESLREAVASLRGQEVRRLTS